MYPQWRTRRSSALHGPSCCAAVGTLAGALWLSRPAGPAARQRLRGCRVEVAALDPAVEPASHLAGEGQHGAERPVVNGDAGEGACRADGQDGYPVDVQPEGAGCPVEVGPSGRFGGAGERELVVYACGGAQRQPHLCAPGDRPGEDAAGQYDVRLGDHGEGLSGVIPECLRIALLKGGLAGHDLPPLFFEGAVGASGLIECVEFGHIVGLPSKVEDLRVLEDARGALTWQ